MLIGTEQLQEIDQILAAGDDAGCAGILLVHLRGMRQMVALLGMDCGASLMDAAQARLRELLRPTDRIYRVASNEFLVCLPDLLSTNHGVLAARKVLGEFDFPLSVQDRPMTPVLSLALAVNAGKRQVKLLPDGWTVVTKDRSLSAQWEHTMLVTETGYEVLTLRKGETSALPGAA